MSGCCVCVTMAFHSLTMPLPHGRTGRLFPVSALPVYQQQQFGQRCSHVPGLIAVPKVSCFEYQSLASGCGHEGDNKSG